MKIRIVVVIGCAALVAACASQRPVLYPNAKLESAGSAQAQHDIDDCILLARQAGVGSKRGRDVAERTATASAVGAAGGAAAGAVRGHAGRGAAAGAAGGAAGGFVAGMIKTSKYDSVTKRWVEACLQERGYRTVGWQ
jgi:hypothetical protein